MWDLYVQRSFFIWRLSSWSRPVFHFFGGTSVLNGFLRALGADIGEGALLCSVSAYFDADMLSVGPGAVISAVRWQLHTFEGRVLKHYRASIGAGAVVTNATVLGGARVGDGATVLPGSCLLKGEELASGRVFCGAPVAQLNGAHPKVIRT
eukprot:SRR837773.14564.p3 GENE.SRR837773.14564~~SRR837773.14564.p3  ORF type:complete len:169 (-),score=63.27 SRR837773.14564:20-472(-)